MLDASQFFKVFMSNITDNENKGSSKSIDDAIEACEVHAKDHSRAALRVQLILLAYIVLLICAGGVIPMARDEYVWSAVEAQKNAYHKAELLLIEIEKKLHSAEPKPPSLESPYPEIHKSSVQSVDILYYILFGIFVIIFGVMMAVYRFHLAEIAKAEHYKIGFMRIRIAANNIEKGFLTEVRLALTDSAFDNGKVLSATGRTKKLESPLPGHPTSDVGTAILNKLLDQVEVHLTTKKRDSHKEGE